MYRMKLRAVGIHEWRSPGPDSTVKFVKHSNMRMNWLLEEDSARSRTMVLRTVTSAFYAGSATGPYILLYRMNIKDQL